MAQQFIVEGNDGYVLSALCEKQGLGLPVGYTRRSYRDFVVKAGGIDNISEAIRTALQRQDVTNLGIVVDANDVGAESRVSRVSSVITEVFPEANFSLNLTPSGWVAQVKPNLTVGLWVMPDNVSSGYLEHFLTRLIPVGNSDLPLAEKFMTQIETPNFSDLKQQKALISLFLAIQEEPGMNAQTAILKGILDVETPLAQRYLSWFSRTFELA